MFASILLGSPVTDDVADFRDFKKDSTCVSALVPMVLASVM